LNFTTRWLSAASFLELSPIKKLALLSIAGRIKGIPQIRFNSRPRSLTAADLYHTHIGRTVSFDAVPLVVIDEVGIKPVIKILGLTQVDLRPSTLLCRGLAEHIDTRVAVKLETELAKLQRVCFATRARPCHVSHVEFPVLH
jgi:hypothetical protein